ncbi:MAG: hypothetical protein RL722_914 [Pseudomonadota bacterium]|jgi:proline dehydrogenase
MYAQDSLPSSSTPPSAQGAVGYFPVRRLQRLEMPRGASVLQAPRHQATRCAQVSEAHAIVVGLAERQMLATLAHQACATESLLTAVEACVEGLGLLAGQATSTTFSLQPGALAFDADVLGVLAAMARDSGVSLMWDSQTVDTADAALHCVRQLVRLGGELGVTLPGRWMRSRADADLAADLGLKVRVVKGRWADPLRPQFDERAGFLAVIGKLAGRARAVSVATHDAPLARMALRRLVEAGTPCELEVTHGVPHQAAVQAARALGVPVRVYVSFGSGGTIHG